MGEEGLIASRSWRLNAPVIAWSVETVGIGTVKVTPVGQRGALAWPPGLAKAFKDGPVQYGDARGKSGSGGCCSSATASPTLLV